jgi:hypothetical protein
VTVAVAELREIADPELLVKLETLLISAQFAPIVIPEAPEIKQFINVS